MAEPYILMIDDSNSEARIFEQLLESRNFKGKFELIGRGLDAIDQLKNPSVTTPNLILLDISLPDIEGWEVLKALKGEKHLSHIPILIRSGSIRKADMDMAKALGATHYLEKPMELLEMERQIDFVLGLIQV